MTVGDYHRHILLDKTSIFGDFKPPVPVSVPESLGSRFNIHRSRL